MEREREGSWKGKGGVGKGRRGVSYLTIKNQKWTHIYEVIA